MLPIFLGFLSCHPWRGLEIHYSCYNEYNEYKPIYRCFSIQDTECIHEKLIGKWVYFNIKDGFATGIISIKDYDNKGLKYAKEFKRKIPKYPIKKKVW